MNTRNPGPEIGSHGSHDRLLIAARAAGDLTEPDLVRADALMAGCAACRTLHVELLAITTATHELPPPTRPPALDFRLSPDRASALARGAIWRRLLRPFGRSGSATLRPLAAAFTTLGVAGLMLAALPNIQLGGASAGAYLTTAASDAPRDAAGRSFTPEIVPPVDHASPLSTGDTTAGEVTGSTDSSFGPLSPTADDKGAQPTERTSAQGGGNTDGNGPGGEPSPALEYPGSPGGPTGAGPLVLLSVGLLGVGLALFLLRLAAIRMR